jgi:hypothetical protein
MTSWWPIVDPVSLIFGLLLLRRIARGVERIAGEFERRDPDEIRGQYHVDAAGNITP